MRRLIAAFGAVALLSGCATIDSTAIPAVYIDQERDFLDTVVRGELLRLYPHAIDPDTGLPPSPAAVANVRGAVDDHESFVNTLSQAR